MHTTYIAALKRKEYEEKEETGTRKRKGGDAMAFKEGEKVGRERKRGRVGLGVV